MALALLGLACDSPTSSDRALILHADGYHERGGVVTLSALRGDSSLTSNVTWSATPVTAVEWLASDKVRLLQSGVVRIAARSGDGDGVLDITVATPPRIVFEKLIGSNRDIWVVDLDGGNLRQLTSDIADDRSPSVAGAFVYFLSNRIQPAALFRVSSSGGTAERITEGTGAFTDPQVSPDGSALTFTRLVSGLYKVFHSALTGGNAQRATAAASLAGGIEGSPAWSADSRSVAFISTADGNAEIYVVTLSGSATGLRRLTTNIAADIEPSWSFDDRRIAFVRAQSGISELLTADAATGAATVLLSRTTSISKSGFLADNRIVFVMGNGDAARLYWIDAQGTPVLIPTGDGIPAAPAAVRAP